MEIRQSALPSISVWRYCCALALPAIVIGAAYFSICGAEFASGLQRSETAAGLSRDQSESPVRVGKRSIVCDLGEVRPRAEVDKVMEVLNDTTDEWINPRVESSCRCSSSTVTPDRVPPGQIANVKIHYRAPDSSGAIDQRLTLRFHGGIAIEFSLHGRVVEWAEVQPSSINIGPIIPGESVSRQIRIDLSRSAGKRFTTRSDSPWLTIEPPTIDVLSLRDGKSVDCATIVDTRRMSVATKSIGRIYIESDQDSEPAVPVTVVATVAPSFVAKPERIFIRSIGAGEVQAADVLLSSVGADGRILPDSVEVSESLADYVRCELSPHSKGSVTGRITIAIPPSPGAAFLNGAIKFTMKRGDTVVVPVNIRIEP